MFVTREMDYCIRIVRALSKGGILSANEISSREHIPAAITYKLLKTLLKAGVVKSFRGAEGGYQLDIDCSQTSLLDLFRKLGIEVLVNKCLSPGYKCENISCEKCKIHLELNRIQNVLMEELGSKTIAELV